MLCLFDPQQLPEGALVNQSIPKVKEVGEWVNAKCSMYEGANGTYSNTSVACVDGWEYSQDEIIDTVVTQVGPSIAQQCSSMRSLTK